MRETRGIAVAAMLIATSMSLPPSAAGAQLQADRPTPRVAADSDERDRATRAGKLTVHSQYGYETRIEHPGGKRFFIRAKLPGLNRSSPTPVLQIKKRGGWVPAPARLRVVTDRGHVDGSMKTQKRNGTYRYRVAWKKPQTGAAVTNVVRLTVRNTSLRDVRSKPADIQGMHLSGDGSTVIYNGLGLTPGGLAAVDTSTGATETLLPSEWVSVHGVSDDGLRILYSGNTTSSPGSYVMDRTTSTETLLPSGGVTGALYPDVLSGNGQYVVLNDYNYGDRQRISLFDLSTMSEAAVIYDQTEPYLRSWHAADITPDGRLVVLSRVIGRDSTSNGNEIAVWNRDTGVFRSLGRHKGEGRRASLSADGGRLFVQSGSSLTLWDLAAGSRTKLPLEANSDHWDSAWLSANGARIVLVGANEHMAVYTVATNTLTLAPFSGSGDGNGLKISDNGATVAVTVFDRLKMWSV